MTDVAGGAVDNAGGDVEGGAVDTDGGAVAIPDSGADVRAMAGALGGVVSDVDLASGVDFESDDAELQPVMAIVRRGISVQGRILMSIWVPSDVYSERQQLP